MGVTSHVADSTAKLEKELAELKAHVQRLVLDERKKAEAREAALEARIQQNLNESLEKERQAYYGYMQMSDHEVSEMVEDTVGYLMQKVDHLVQYHCYLEY